MAGQWLAIARKHGRTETYIQLRMESEAAPPSDKNRIPLQAWTLLNIWFREGGRKSGSDLPDWVWDYLSETSFNLQALRADQGTSSADKLQQISAALAYTSGRRNAFSDDFQAVRNETAALVYENDGHRGLTGDARIEGVKSLLGLEDTRTAKLYVAKGRRDAKRPPPWLKK